METKLDQELTSICARTPDGQGQGGEPRRGTTAADQGERGGGLDQSGGVRSRAMAGVRKSLDIKRTPFSGCPNVGCESQQSRLTWRHLA